MRTILVIGATGNQGWAVTEALLRKKSEYAVRALVRGPNSIKARALESRGAELCVGDLDKPETLRRAMRDASGVFCFTNFMGERGIRKGILSGANYFRRGIERERERGMRVVDVACEQGVSHFIYSGLVRIGGVLTTESKADVETHLKTRARHSNSFTYTIARPVSFMRNFEEAHPRSLGYTAYRHSMGEDRWLWVDLDDFGEVVADIFSQREYYASKVVTVASEEASYADIAKAYRSVYGRNPISWYWRIVPGFAFRSAYPFLGHIGKVLKNGSRINEGLRSHAVFVHRNPPTTFAEWYAKRKRVYDTAREFAKRQLSAEEVFALARHAPTSEEAWLLLSVVKEMQ